MPAPTLTFIENGFTWVARFVPKGERYGRNMCLVNKEDKPLVEFYDGDQDKPSHGPHGQLVSRYYVETIMERLGGGLDLHGGVPRWSIDVHSLALVQKWLSEQMGPTSK